MERDVKTRILSHSDQDHGSGCWLWTKAVNKDGYGCISIGNKQRRAHRAAWEAWNGPIPEGMQLDHKCRVRHCVNPAHLEPVTNTENIRRGLQGVLKPDTCRNGHLLAEKGFFLIKRKWGTEKRCKACQIDASKRYQSR